ncbi:hypothetical protein ACJZ2D_016138 [Fusarium nematophilum]
MTPDIHVHQFDGTVPTLIGDSRGDFIWRDPVVAVMRAGNEYEPRPCIDITLTAYRDTIGSMIDEPGRQHHLSRVILSERTSKVTGIRINCRRDQAIRQEPQMVEVAVPKTHPLFSLEGDDRCDISQLFDLTGCKGV